jgi:hypothetical protein
MIACVIHGAKDLQIETRSEPKPSAGEVIVRFGAGGICGSDLHYYHEGRVGNFELRVRGPQHPDFEYVHPSKRPILIKSTKPAFRQVNETPSTTDSAPRISRVGAWMMSDRICADASRFDILKSYHRKIEKV